LAIWVGHSVRLKGRTTGRQTTSSSRWELTSIKYLDSFLSAGKLDLSISTSNNISSSDKSMLQTQVTMRGVNIITGASSETSAQMRLPQTLRRTSDRRDTAGPATSSKTSSATCRSRASRKTKKRNASQLTRKLSENSQSSKSKINIARRATMAN
jgi:hypothetical protein